MAPVSGTFLPSMQVPAHERGRHHAWGRDPVQRWEVSVGCRAGAGLVQDAQQWYVQLNTLGRLAGPIGTILPSDREVTSMGRQTELPTRKGIPATGLSEMPQSEAKSMDCGPRLFEVKPPAD